MPSRNPETLRPGLAQPLAWSRVDSRRRSVRRAPVLMAALALALLMVLLVPAAQATDYTITVFDDFAAEDDNCDLREALLAATTDSAVDVCPAGSASDTITLLPARYVFNGGGFEMFTEGEDLTISGAGSETVVLMNRRNRFLHSRSTTTPNSVTLENFILALGRESAPIGSTVEGGALLMEGTDLILKDMVFSENEARRGDGGAVAFLNEGISPPPVALTILDSFFEENSAIVGGALRVLGDRISAEIRATRFEGNESAFTGGGIDLAVQDGELTLDGVDFVGNRAGERAGASVVLDGVAAAGPRFEAVLRDCRFEDNLADLLTSVEGGLYGNGLHLTVAKDTETLVEKLWFSGNDNGGASRQTEQLAVLAEDGARVRLHNVVILDSEVAGFQFDYDESSATPAEHLRVQASHFTIIGNARPGEVRKLGSAPAPSSFEVAVERSINWNNRDRNLVGPAEVAFVDNLENVDPLFNNPGIGDYRLSEQSPAVDATGPPSARHPQDDFQGVARPQGPAPDLGAFERQLESLEIFTDGFESGDLTAWSSSAGG